MGEDLDSVLSGRKGAGKEGRKGKGEEGRTDFKKCISRIGKMAQWVEEDEGICHQWSEFIWVYSDPCGGMRQWTPTSCAYVSHMCVKTHTCSHTQQIRINVNSKSCKISKTLLLSGNICELNNKCFGKSRLGLWLLPLTMESRTSCILGKLSTTELYLQASFYFLLQDWLSLSCLEFRSPHSVKVRGGISLHRPTLQWVVPEV